MALTFEYYSQKASTTAVYESSLAVEYTTLGLCSEAGELAGKVKRKMRGDKKEISKEDALLEIGDCLWYLSECAKAFGSDLETVAKMNIEKLSKRKIAGTIRGEGDDR